MADKQPEKKQDKQEKQTKKADKPVAEKRRPDTEESNEVLVRILGYDIPGSKNLISGLTRIKGISWAISNAACLKLGMAKSTRINELSKPDIQKIEAFLREMPLADYMKNRRHDVETGETKHYLGSDLDIKREFDIKRLKEIKSYKGLRHALRLPVRGQRTRSHFRSKGQAMGVKRKSK